MTANRIDNLIVLSAARTVTGSIYEAPAASKSRKPSAAVFVTFDTNWQGLTYRVPNKTGHGSHKFSIMASVEYKGKTYRAQLYQMARACNLHTAEVAIYGAGGRMLPESNLPHVRAAIIADYVDIFGCLAWEAETPPAPASHAMTDEKAALAIGLTPKTIDCAPTWAALVPAFVAMVENGSAASRAMAIEELTRLARFADSAIAKAKA